MVSINAFSQSSQKEYVVLLHGIFRTSAHMKPLAHCLEQHGYEVLNIDYPSTKFSLEELIKITSSTLDEKILDKNRTVNFVGYSMGGLIARGIIAQHRPDHLGRVVLIATPNQGSEVADFLKNNFIYKKLYGPAGQQLTTDSNHSKLFGPVDYELGIIAGNASLDPISSFLISGKDDGKVSVESTKLEGMQDHVTVCATHTFFPSNKIAQQQVLAFLKHGRFN